MTHVVDAHHHVWDLAVRDQPWIVGTEMEPIRRTFTVHDYAAEARGAGASESVLVQTIADPDETPDLLAIAAADDLVVAVTGWSDLTAPDAAERIAALRAGEGGSFLRGIRHGVQDEADPAYLDRHDVRRGLRAVADTGLLFELLLLPHQLPAAIDVVSAIPGTFVLDHAAKPRIASGETEPWASDVRRLARFDNVVCKLSGLVTEADWRRWTVDDLRPYVDVLLDCFGPARLMFGSDWPVCLLAATYAEVVATVEQLTDDLTPAERASIFGGTARRIYALDP